MKPVAKKATPAAIAVLRQATALRPKRKRASDGLLPSAAHLKANPTSDHNTGFAVDLTHDVESGINCQEGFGVPKGATALMMGQTSILSTYISQSRMVMEMTQRLGSRGWISLRKTLKQL
jgi:hypothetical protein